MHVHLYRNNPALVMNFVARELDPVLMRPHDHLERVSRAKFTRNVDAELQKIPAALAGLQRARTINHSHTTSRARVINNCHTIHNQPLPHSHTPHTCVARFWLTVSSPSIGSLHNTFARMWFDSSSWAVREQPSSNVHACTASVTCGICDT